MTGAGPFSMIVGLLGVVTLGVGAVFTRLSHRGEGVAAAGDAGFGALDEGWSNAPLPADALAEGRTWLAAQLSEPRLGS